MPSPQGSQDVVPIPEEVQKKIRLLESLVEQLQQQLSKARGGDQEEQLPLEEVESRLKEAFERLMNGDESAQADFDEWDRRLNEHPEKIALEARKEAEWEEEQRVINLVALSICRGFIPPDIARISSAELCERGVPKPIADRIWAKKCLWFTQMDPTFIAKMHIADLNTKFSPHKLDLVELRAVYAALPDQFENDKGGEKKSWRTDFRTKLKKAIDGQASAKPEDLRSKCYFSNEGVPIESIFPIQAQNDETYEKMIEFIISVGTKHQEEEERKKVTKASTKPSSNKGKLNPAFAQNLAAVLGGPPKKKNPVFAQNLAAVLGKKGTKQTNQDERATLVETKPKKNSFVVETKPKKTSFAVETKPTRASLAIDSGNEIELANVEQQEEDRQPSMRDLLRKFENKQKLTPIKEDKKVTTKPLQLQETEFRSTLEKVLGNKQPSRQQQHKKFTKKMMMSSWVQISEQNEPGEIQELVRALKEEIKQLQQQQTGFVVGEADFEAQASEENNDVFGFMKNKINSFKTNIQRSISDSPLLSSVVQHDEYRELTYNQRKDQVEAVEEDNDWLLLLETNDLV